MATKAQRFRYEAERAGPKKPKSPPRRRRDELVDTAMPGVSATDRKAGLPRKASLRAGRKAAYLLERTAGKRSRKSTRKAANRQRTDAQMRIKRRNTAVRLASREA
jgi:hypothetical protein